MIRHLLRRLLRRPPEGPVRPAAARTSGPTGAPPHPAPDVFHNAPSFQPSPLPPEVEGVLRAENPRLVELKARLSAFAAPVTDHVSWTDRYLRDELDLERFRGDNAYVWQLRGLRDRELAHLKYIVTTYYVEKIDVFGLLGKLDEDGLFGVHTFEVNGRKVSRDLLDSINEIYFLERHLGLTRRSAVRILDVGAGYGRLAHRMVAAFDQVERYLCTDAVAESTFLSEFYLRFRGLSPRAAAVPVDEIEDTLRAETVDVAVNVHSFSECTAAAVGWWLELLARSRIRHLMVVPNDGERLLSREKDGSHVDLDPLLAEVGYTRVVVEPKFLDPSVQSFGVHSGFYHLFELA